MHSVRIITGVVVTADPQSRLRRRPVRGAALRLRPRTNNSEAAQPGDDGNFKKTLASAQESSSFPLFPNRKCSHAKK